MSQVPSTATVDPNRIDAIFAKANQSNLPGAAVAIAIDGVPVYRKGFGLANMELPVSLSPSMRMRIGSTTKHFTCLAFMLLCEEGLADVDDEVGRWIDQLHPASRGVTMRQLMGHTSGLRDIFSISLLFHGFGAVVTDKELFAYYATIDDLGFEPGTRWTYNNGAYMLLSMAIERIAGASLADVLRQRIFEPIGMYDTLLRPWDTDFLPNSATLHAVNRQGQYTRDYIGMEMSGAGGIVSTMDDMLRWLKHMDRPVVGSAQTWKLMKEPHFLANGMSTDYGFGLFNNRYRGIEVLSHAGGVFGGNSQMMKVPAAKLDISVAANRADLNTIQLANQIIDACIEDLDPMPEPGEGDPRDGVFVSRRDGRVVELIAKDGTQFVSIDAMPAVPMTFDADGALQLPVEMAFLKRRIILGEKKIRLVEFGEVAEFEEVDRVPDGDPVPLIGGYVNDELAVRLTISDGNEGPRLISTGRHGTASYALASIGQRIWKASALGPVAMLGFIVNFDADGEGLTARTERVDNIRFRRVT